LVIKIDYQQYCLLGLNMRSHYRIIHIILFLIDYFNKRNFSQIEYLRFLVKVITPKHFGAVLISILM